MSNFIIKHPDTFSLPAYNEEYRAGKINGLARQTCHKLFNISSCVRELDAPSIFKNNKKYNICLDTTCGNCDRCCYLKQWTSTNFNVRLPEVLNKVVKVTLSALEIPNTIYSISNINQTNVFQIINSNTQEIFIIELPSGNYEVDQLSVIINNIIGSCSITDFLSGYDTISGRFFFYNTSLDSSNQYEIDFNIPNNNRDIKLNLGWMLGFRKERYCTNSYVAADDVWKKPDYDCSTNKDKTWPCRKYTGCGDNLRAINGSIWTDPTATDTSFPNGYISEGIVDITGPKYLFLLVNDFNNNVNSKYCSLASSGSSISASNILARISMPYGKNEIGFDDTSDLIPKSREYFGPVSIEKLHIKLVDDVGRQVDLNKNEISLLLDFEYVYNL